MTAEAQQISRSILELSDNLALGALDSDDYLIRSEMVANEAAAILESGETHFLVNIAGQELRYPIVRFGSSVTSLNLFEYKELSVFALYALLSRKVERFCDLGSNIGSHSVCLAALGASVRSWDPDRTVSGIQRQLFREHGFSCTQIDAAAGIVNEGASFVRLEDNQTGSHLAGRKPNPYGRITTHYVEVKDCRPDIAWADLVKMDIEGSEAEILCQTAHEILSEAFIICEVTDKSAAHDLYEYLSVAPVSMFSQRYGWRIPVSVQDLPAHHSHGSLLIVGHESRLRSHLRGIFDECLGIDQ